MHFPIYDLLSEDGRYVMRRIVEKSLKSMQVQVHNEFCLTLSFERERERKREREREREEERERERGGGREEVRERGGREAER